MTYSKERIEKKEWPIFIACIVGASSCGHQHSKEHEARFCAENLARRHPSKPISLIEYKRKFLGTSKGKPEYEVDHVVLEYLEVNQSPNLDNQLGQSRN